MDVYNEPLTLCFVDFCAMLNMSGISGLTPKTHTGSNASTTSKSHISIADEIVPIAMKLPKIKYCMNPTMAINI